MNRAAIIPVLLSIVLLFLSSCGHRVEKPHILLITIDTLRRDHLSCYDYPRITSPFIDSMAQQGVRFKNVVTHETITSPSHASILTSLHPLSLDLTMNSQKLNEKFSTIAEVLKQDGYYTIGAVSVKILKKFYQFDQGFDAYEDTWEEGKENNTNHQRTAVSVNRDVFKQIDAYLSDPQHNKKPLFMWVHYYDPHFPYLDHEDIQFQNKLPVDDSQISIRNYDKEIRYTDRHIRLLYKYLEEKGLTKQMVTCITADHGEQLGEHGRPHGHSDFYSETTHVPLILKGPGIPKEKVVENYVSTVDIGVTLLKLAGLKFPYAVEGIDLLSERAEGRKRKFLVYGNPHYARSLQLITHPYSYILNFDYHYKHWYIGDGDGGGLPLERFINIPSERLVIRKHTLSVPLSQNFKKGYNYLVLRADILQPVDCSVDMRIRPFISSGVTKLPKGVKKLNIVYPMTIMDGLLPKFTIEHIDRDPSQYIQNVKYAIINQKELDEAINNTYLRIYNLIYKKLRTPRKRTLKDELFFLPEDIKMEQNIIDNPKLTTKVVQYRKIIYAAFKYYFLKRNKLLRGEDSGTELSPQEEEMLKSLGYL